MSWEFAHEQYQGSERDPAAQVNGVVQFTNDDIIVYLMIIKQFDKITGIHAARFLRTFFAGGWGQMMALTRSITSSNCNRSGAPPGAKFQGLLL